MAYGLLLLLTGPVLAQTTARMNGTVLDEKGEPLAGVTVLLNEAGATGTPSGTATNSIGVFTFDNLRAATRYNVTVSYVGYVSQKISNFLVNAGDNNSLMLRLSADTKSLSDVVVIGYGTQSKAKVTGVISEVKGQDLKRYSGSSFGQQLAGRAAGVVINDASGQPGTDPQIVIRGIGTLTAGRNPLIVVDGFPLTEGSSLNSINPQDIEKIDILKDPSSAAIYGSRAANGVVIITTKKSKADKATVSLDVYTACRSVPTRWNTWTPTRRRSFSRRPATTVTCRLTRTPAASATTAPPAWPKGPACASYASTTYSLTWTIRPA
jgi:TonB-dependent SusC/RagA subfamily outer membrane receptor